MPDVAGSMQKTGALADALQDLLRTMIEKIIGGPSTGKGGEPLRDVCVMVMPLGEPIDPRDFSYAWDPAGGASGEDVQDDGKFGVTPPPAAPQPAAAAQSAAGTTAPAAPATPELDTKLQHSMASAKNIAFKFDRMLRVTDDGTYRPFTSAGTLSSSYEAIITKAQGIPAPAPPANIQKQIDDAMHLLYVFDAAGNQKGKTKDFKNYEILKQAYSDAEAAFANAQASAMTNAALGQAWPVTSKSYKTAVDNAYDDWRSANAEAIENALETLKSVGGSIGNHFLAQARALYDAWDLGLTGSVAVGTPYTQIMPGSWYDPNDTENGFESLNASNTQYQSYRGSNSSQIAASCYSGQCSSTSAGAAGMVFGVTFGGSGGHSDQSQQSHSTTSGSQFSAFSQSMSNVSLTFEFGLCDIYRPWLLKELFVIDGWYLPGQKDNVVSDGTIAGQKSDNDSHMLPMIPTQFLVVRNVKITADGWGMAGDQMSSYCRQAESQDQSSSSCMSGGVGFLCVGGTVSRSNADWSGSDSESASAAGSCFFTGDGNHGTLTINGCQIVGWVGEIMPASPKHDGTKEVAAPAPAAASSKSTGTGTSTGTTTPASTPA